MPMIQQIRFQGLSFSAELEGIELDFSSHPVYLTLIPWELCNWHCRYCHQDRQAKEANELTLAEMERMIDEAPDLGIRAVLFLGGEVILKKVWPITSRIIAHIDRRGMIPVIYTNGAEMTSEIADFLADHNTSIALKCDSLDPAKYDYLAGTKGAYDAFHRTLDLVKRTPIGSVVTVSRKAKLVRLLLSTVGNRLNVSEYVSLARFATNQGARWMMEVLNCHGAAATNIEELAVDPTVHAQSMSLALRLNPAQSFDGGVATNGCRLFAGITIRKTGEVAICPQDYHFLGNIRELGSLAQIWRLIQTTIRVSGHRESWFQGRCPLKRKEVKDESEGRESSLATGVHGCRVPETVAG